MLVKEQLKKEKPDRHLVCRNGENLREIHSENEVPLEVLLAPRVIAVVLVTPDNERELVVLEANFGQEGTNGRFMYGTMDVNLGLSGVQYELPGATSLIGPLEPGKLLHLDISTVSESGKPESESMIFPNYKIESIYYGN